MGVVKLSSDFYLAVETETCKPEYKEQRTRLGDWDSIVSLMLRFFG